MYPLDYLMNIREQYRCSVCLKEKNIEPHHIIQIGMGRDRKKQLIEHYSAIPVCRPCHQDYHSLGKKTFQFKYNVNIYEIAFDYLSKIIYTESMKNELL